MKNINTSKGDSGHDSEYQEEKKEGLIALFLTNWLPRMLVDLQNTEEFTLCNNDAFTIFCRRDNNFHQNSPCHTR